jgi:hypothetical protein
MSRLLQLAALACFSTLLLSGCGWHEYVAARAFRHFTGAKLRYHSITPLQGSLNRYRTIEVEAFDNEVLDQIPVPMERYFNGRVLAELRSVKSNPKVQQETADRDGTANQPTLVLTGAIEDYDPGYVGLRMIELGFNHVAVTVRYELHDKDSGEIVAAASLSAQDDRVNASPKAAMNKIVRRIRNVINSGYKSKQ